MSGRLQIIVPGQDQHLSSINDDSVMVPSLRSYLRPCFLLAVTVTMLFFVIASVWAITAPLAGVVQTTGIVSAAQTRRQTVQHLEGGIIRAVKVVEGDHVNAGDELIILEDVAALSDFGTIQNRIIALAAQEARLEAERKGLRIIDFSHPALADRNNLVVRDAIQQEQNRLNGRIASDENRKAVLEQRIAQLGSQVVGFEERLRGVRRQFSLFQQEFDVASNMLKKGLERRPRVQSIERSLAGQISAEGELTANIARARESIVEIKFQIDGINRQRMEMIDQELAESVAKRAEAEEQVRKISDQLKRKTVRAPSTGTVLNVRFKTPGAVVRAGEPILDIVPTEERLVIDTRISPQDIDRVHVNLSATVIFPSYSQRNLLRITGRVINVSADSLQEEKIDASSSSLQPAKSNGRYFTAKIEVDEEKIKAVAHEIKLLPGLPAQVNIATPDRTLSNYLLQPVQLFLERSFREH